jgi:hypothetical protein
VSKRRGRPATPTILAPIVMGEGRAAWDAAYADAHARGGKPRTSRLLSKTQSETICSRCGRRVVAGAYVVRSRRQSGFEHAACARTDDEPRVFRRQWNGGSCEECGAEISRGAEVGRFRRGDGAIRLVHAHCARDTSATTPQSPGPTYGTKIEAALPPLAPAASLVNPKARPKDTRCEVCGEAFLPGQILVPLGPAGPITRWAHRNCRQAKP